MPGEVSQEALDAARAAARDAFWGDMASPRSVGHTPDAAERWGLAAVRAAAPLLVADAQARIDKALAQHARTHYAHVWSCACCDQDWPCATVRALSGDTPGGDT